MGKPGRSVVAVMALCASMAFSCPTSPECVGPDCEEGPDAPVDVEVTFRNASNVPVTLEYSGGGRSGAVSLALNASSAVTFRSVTTFAFNLFVRANVSGRQFDTSCRLGNTGYQARRAIVQFEGQAVPPTTGVPYRLACVGWGSTD